MAPFFAFSCCYIFVITRSETTLIMDHNGQHPGPVNQPKVPPNSNLPTVESMISQPAPSASPAPLTASIIVPEQPQLETISTGPLSTTTQLPGVKNLLLSLLGPPQGLQNINGTPSSQPGTLKLEIARPIEPHIGSQPTIIHPIGHQNISTTATSAPLAPHTMHLSTGGGGGGQEQLTPATSIPSQQLPRPIRHDYVDIVGATQPLLSPTRPNTWPNLVPQPSNAALILNPVSNVLKNPGDPVQTQLLLLPHPSFPTKSDPDRLQESLHRPPSLNSPSSSPVTRPLVGSPAYPTYLSILLDAVSGTPALGSASSAPGAAANSNIAGPAFPKKDPPTSSGGRFAKHLKKSDGEPFWRKDIQYDFLRFLFNDEHRVFTNPFPNPNVVGVDNPPKYTFSELYVRTLAESGKSSKVLKERLLKDTEMGVSVGKVCLLVNSGRMNTTINFVPEMRLTLRTYHSIPSLQADPVYGGLKPLQDTPRLKLILKLVCEGQEHLKSIQDILDDPSTSKPNTNIIQLIFLLSNYPRGIKYLQDDLMANNFIDFFLNDKIHPQNRANRFLWIVYTFLETSFKDEELANNPFGGATIPPEQLLEEEEVKAFDQDTAFEIKFSQEMMATRQRYLNDEEHNSTPKRGNKLKRDRELDETEEDDRKRTFLLPKEEPEPSLSASQYSNGSNPGSSSANGGSNSAVGKTDDFQYTDFVPLTSDHVLQFPVEGLSEMVAKLSQTNDKPPTTRSSMANHLNIISKLKPLIRQIKTTHKIREDEFEARKQELRSWIQRYFQYRKSSGRGLLGMEWENTRHDLINGIESFIYKQTGKQYQTYLAPTLVSSGSTNGNDEEIGFGFVPIYDFNKNNELNQFHHDVLSLGLKQAIGAEMDHIQACLASEPVKIDMENNIFTIDLGL